MLTTSFRRASERRVGLLFLAVLLSHSLAMADLEKTRYNSRITPADTVPKLWTHVITYLVLGYRLYE
jgi:hypothetical protein